MNSPRYTSLYSALLQSQGEDSVSKAIRRLVMSVRQETDQFDIPVAPTRIANRLGLRVEALAFEAEGALDEGCPDGPRILVRRTDRSTKSNRHRRKFTVAHELGHFILRRELRPLVHPDVFSDDNDAEERLCDRFAAELLMPMDAILPQLLQHATSPTQLLRIARNYDVSVQALVSRVAGARSKRADLYCAIIWRKQGDMFRPQWSYPRSMSGAILCDTGGTSVEKSVQYPEEQSGNDTLLLDGTRVRVQSRTCRLGTSAHELFLTIGVRGKAFHGSSIRPRAAVWRPVST